MSKIKYIITSSSLYYNDARSYVIDSLICNKIDIKDIFIILNRSNNTYIKIGKHNTPTAIYLDSNIYEYSFFIGSMMLTDAKLVKTNDLFFLIHDTCIAGLKFLTKTTNAAIAYPKYDIIYANNWGAHNIGIYNYKAITIGFNKFNYKEIINKSEAIDFERLKHLEYSPKSWNLKQFFPKYGNMYMGKVDPYEDNNLRICSYLAFFDLYKYFFWGGIDGAGTS